MVSVKQQAPPANAMRMGLEKEGLRLFEGASTSFTIPHKNGKFIHGLSDNDKKLVESHYGLKFDNPEDFESWRQLVFTIRHTMEVLDPKNAESILKQSVAKLTGIATDADNPDKNADFIFSSEFQDEEAKLSNMEKHDRAVSKLLELKETPKYLLAVAKHLYPPTTGIGQNVNNAYIKLREYLDGTLSTKKEAVANFEKACNLDKTMLYVTVDFRDALMYNIIRRDKDNFYFNVLSTCRYGKTESECVEYLMDIKNQEELGTGDADDAPYSIKAQLRAKVKY